jgi:hypothetical protein
VQLSNLSVEGTVVACRAGSGGSLEVVEWAKLGEPHVVGRTHCLVDMHRGTRRNKSPWEGQVGPESLAGSWCDQVEELR